MTSETTNVWMNASRENVAIAQAPNQQMEEFEVKSTSDPSIKIISYITQNEQNQRVRVTKTVQRQVSVKKVRKSVQHRRLWDKFGMGIGGRYYQSETGDEYKVSTEEETNPFIRTTKATQNEAEKVLADVIKEYFEQGSGGSQPFRVSGLVGEVGGPSEVGGIPSGGGSSATGAYVAPHLQAGGEQRSRFEETAEEVTSLRLANISNEMGEEKGLLHGLIKHQWKKVMYLRLQKNYENQLKAFKEERDSYHQRFELEHKEFEKLQTKKGVTHAMLKQQAERTKRYRDDWQIQGEKVKKFEVKRSVLREFVPGRIDKYAVERKLEDLSKYQSESPALLAAQFRNKLRWLVLDDFEFLIRDYPMRRVMRGISVNYDYRDEGYFAYVRFYNRQDAEEIMNVLKGQTIGNLIIRVEWAKPRRRRF